MLSSLLSCSLKKTSWSWSNKDFPRSLSQIVIQNSRLSSGSLCSKLCKPSCDSALRRMEKQIPRNRLLRWCWGATLNIIWILGIRTFAFSNLPTALQDTLLWWSRLSHWSIKQTLIHRTPVISNVETKSFFDRSTWERIQSLNHVGSDLFKWK